MDIRTKLVFSLVAISLASMLTVGALAYTNAAELLTERSLRQLNSLAEAKSERLESVIEGWHDAVALIASRTQLRLSLQSYNASGGAAERDLIERILDDAEAASVSVEVVAVYDRDGEPVAWVGRRPDAETSIPLDSSSVATTPGVVFEGVTDGEPTRVVFRGSLAVNGERIGVLRAWLNTADLRELGRNYAGLGETGEALVVTRAPDDGLRLLSPLRHGDAAPAGLLMDDRGREPLERALRGEEGPFDEGLIDYRGEPVWVATRLLPEVGWGVVVKFDADEERAGVREFRDRLLGVIFSLSAFAILLGTLLGLRFAKPIHDLAEVANRIRVGEMDARADAGREDEIGLLASTFNDMGDELQRRMTLLQEYKRFFDLSPDMLCVAGTDGFFKRVNPAFERSLGWSEEELLGRPFVEFVHPDDVDRTIAETDRLSRGIPTVSFANRYRCPDGSYKRLRWTCHPDRETGLLYAIARHVPHEE